MSKNIEIIEVRVKGANKSGKKLKGVNKQLGAMARRAGVDLKYNKFQLLLIIWVKN